MAFDNQFVSGKPGIHLLLAGEFLYEHISGLLVHTGAGTSITQPWWVSQTATTTAAKDAAAAGDSYPETRHLAQ